MKRTHRLIHNTIFSIGGWAVPIVLSFVFTPYIVGKLGNDAYGILTLVWSVIGYFAFLDLGLGRALVKFVAEYSGKKDLDAVNESIGSALLIALTLGIPGAILIFASAGILSSSVLKIPCEFEHVAFVAFRLGAVGFLAAMMQTLFRAIPNGLNRYDVTSVTSVCTKAFSAVAAAGLLAMGGGLVHVVALYVSIPIVTSVIYSVAARVLLPGIRFRLRTRPVVFKRVLNFGLFAVLSRIAYVFARYADRLVIGTMIGVASVTFYAVPLLLVGRISSLTQHIGNVVFPAVSQLQGEQQQAAVVDLYLTASRLMTALSTAICLPLLVFGSRLLALWMTPEFAEEVGMVIVFVTLGVYVDCQTNIPAFVVDGLGQPKVTGISAITQAALFVALMIPFAEIAGITGVALAGFLSNAFVGLVFVIYATTRVVGISLQRMVLEALLRPMVLGVAFWGLLRLVPQARVTNLFVLLGIIGVSALMYLLACIPVGIVSARERRVLMEYVQLFRNRRER